MSLKMKLVLSVAAAVAFAGHAGAQNYAWWLTKSYAPSEATIAGLPVASLRPSWKSAQTFTPATFTRKEHADMYSAPDFRPVWEVRRDINGDGRQDRAIVGVAKTKANKLERFLVILTQDGKGGWKKDYVNYTQTSPSDGDRGFSYLVDRGRYGISWNDCFECDGTFGTIKWDRKKKKYFLEQPDYGDEDY